MTVYLCEGELVCEHCAIDVTEDEQAIGGESDSPCHCSYCHEPLFDTFGLTSDGIAYVIASCREALQRGTAPTIWRWEHGYYKGLGREAVMRDWCDYILDNPRSFDRRSERMLRWYLYLTEPGTHGHPSP